MLTLRMRHSAVRTLREPAHACVAQKPDSLEVAFLLALMTRLEAASVERQGARFISKLVAFNFIPVEDITASEPCTSSLHMRNVSVEYILLKDTEAQPTEDATELIGRPVSKRTREHEKKNYYREKERISDETITDIGAY